VTLQEATELIVAMTDELVEARRGRDSYRLLAHQAIHYNHELQIENRQLKDRYHRLLDETRNRRRAA
jgi:hypothetical protein